MSQWQRPEAMIESQSPDWLYAGANQRQVGLLLHHSPSESAARGTSTGIAARSMMMSWIDAPGFDGQSV